LLVNYISSIFCNIFLIELIKKMKTIRDENIGLIKARGTLYHKKKRLVTETNRFDFFSKLILLNNQFIILCVFSSDYFSEIST
jgi:hypothetical protein